MAAWEAVDALERSRVGEQVELRKGTLQQRLGLGLHHPRLDLAVPEGGHIQAGQRRRGGDGGQGLEQEREQERWPGERERWREADEEVHVATVASTRYQARPFLKPSHTWDSDWLRADLRGHGPPEVDND